MAASMARKKRNLAPLQLAQYKCIGGFAERSLHHMFAHSRKSGHGVQAAASDDANLRCLQLSRSSSGRATARQPRQLFAAGPIHNFTLAEPKYIVPARYSSRPIAALITPADDIIRTSDSPGSGSPAEESPAENGQSASAPSAPPTPAAHPTARSPRCRAACAPAPEETLR